MVAEVILVNNSRQLLIDGQPWMFDAPAEVETTREFCEGASGKVLCLGLGLNVVGSQLRRNPNVTDVDIVELNQSVINLVRAPGCNVIKADALSYVPSRRYDFVYLDIWQYFTTAAYSEYQEQKERYYQYANNVWGAFDNYLKLGIEPT